MDQHWKIHGSYAINNLFDSDPVSAVTHDDSYKKIHSKGCHFATGPLTAVTSLGEIRHVLVLKPDPIFIAQLCAVVAMRRVGSGFRTTLCPPILYVYVFGTGITCHNTSPSFCAGHFRHTA